MENLLHLRITKVIPESADTATFLLEEINGRPVSYQSGQFLTFLLTIGGRELRRSYSLSSAPGIDSQLAVTVRKVVNGEVSRYILSHWKEGDLLTALPPTGRFTLQPNTGEPRDIFLIGAGSGLTPLFSLLKTLLREEPQSQIILIDSNKNERTALFWEEINRLATRHPNFTCIHLLGEPAPENKPLQGRLNIGLLEELVSNHLRYNREKAEFYVCGPFTFMRMVRMTLIFMQFHEEQIHRENFVTDLLSTVKKPVPLDSSLKTVHIHYKGRTYHLQVPGDQPILKAALEKDIRLPYSCLGGVCSTCSAICTEGTVQMTINEVLTEKDLAKGWVLTCVGYPATERVSLEIP